MMKLNLSPFPNLETDRLLLSMLKQEDAHGIFQLRTNEVVNRYIDRPAYLHLKEAENFIQTIRDQVQKNEVIYWGLHLKGHPEVIGTLCLWNISLVNRRAEIGYELHPNYHRKGIMQEALHKALNYAFRSLKFHSIEAHVYPDNTSSIKLLKNNHFRQEALFKENSLRNNQFVDSAIYGLLRKEWINNNPIN